MFVVGRKGREEEGSKDRGIGFKIFEFYYRGVMGFDLIFLILFF